MSSPASWWRLAKRLPWRQPMTILRRHGAHWSRRCGASQRPVRVVLDATGIYFLDLARELAAARIAVMVLNPKSAPGREQGAAVLVIGELAVLPPNTARQ